ncbi:heme NO-binding domain-containing protein [uncultured Neptuniibacter sp.]|uniref:heme NO-binding domain-containing protein n=1 Tax=uncultured Neptuniibacter sp. TaxID=502143 RepID=UPI00262C1CA0|nr:heme NO-binding domain-containing protein [uncultured Neptuniibacter sp.]
MKGVVFNILEEMVISNEGMQVWNNILQSQQLEGIYTAGDSYPDSELFALVNEISAQTGVPCEKLIGHFGEFLFSQLAERFPMFVDSKSDLIAFLRSVDSVIHLEVKKLFTDPSLPRFEYEDLSDGRLLMRYHSPRRLCILAEGLIRGAASLYKTEIELEHEVCCHKGDSHCDLIVRIIE